MMCLNKKVDMFQGYGQVRKYIAAQGKTFVCICINNIMQQYHSYKCCNEIPKI